MGVTTGKTVLMVDDDRDLIAVVERVLQNVGMVLTVSATIEDGIRESISNPPDLIILDLSFVGEKRSGLDFLKVRKEHALIKNIPVIVFSASNSKSTVLKSIALGAEDFLIKPLNSSNLLSKIRKVLKSEPDKELFFSEDQQHPALLTVSCEIHRISELNLVINGPLKAAANHSLAIDSSLMKRLRLDALPLKTGRLLNSNSSGFSFTVDFIGIKEDQMTSIRREGNKWNR